MYPPLGTMVRSLGSMAAPLARYRILHLSTNVPGPIAARRLAQAGAQLTKVEAPSGDALSVAAPEWYRELHQGQTIHKLDLKTPEGLKRMGELLAESDLFLTTTRPQGLVRLGLDWKNLHHRHPALCMVQIQGFPAPRENVPAHDLCCQARAGLLSPPMIPRVLVSDFAAGERAFSAALVCLLGRQDLGEGSQAVVTLQESAEAFAAGYRHGLTRGDGILGGALPGYGLYRAKSGWVAFAALEPHFMESFRAELKLEDASEDTLTEVFRTRTAREWEEFGEHHDIPIAAVAGSESASAD